VVKTPDNLTVKRALAQNYYNNRDWSRLDGALAELLRQNSRDGDLLLMRAHMLVEQGQFVQAQAPLDQYAPINSANRLYLFLRARVQNEGYHDRDAALNYLRSMLNSPAVNDEISVYTVKLLMDSSRAADQEEGRELLYRLLNAASPSRAIIETAFQDAVKRQAWEEAEPYLGQLRDGSADYLLNAYLVKQGLGKYSEALAFAREIYQRDSANEYASLAYTAALIDTGQLDDASALIERRLAELSGGSAKSQYYYLRSRIRQDELSIEDLHASLFEDPRNLSALISLFEQYHRAQDKSRAGYYLKQALALSPNNQRLQPDKPVYGH
jgi:thioredoxin-like negative regulator of GroEL